MTVPPPWSSPRGGYPPTGFDAPRHPRPHPPAPPLIPLRPLGLADIFNGAAVYIRSNPAATLGPTALVVVLTQLVSLAASAGPVAAANRLRSDSVDHVTGGDVAAWLVPAGLSAAVGWVAAVLLTGMLSVVVGHAVFGARVSAGDAWARIRRRLPAVAGLVGVEAAGLLGIVGVVAAIIGATVAAGNVTAAVMLGSPLVLTAVAGLAYLYVALSFAPVLIVLEGLPVTAALARSFTLVQGDFWRIFGIRALAWLVVTLVTGAIGVPFDFLGHAAGASPWTAATIGALGAAIGRIVTIPFSAGVVILLYADRRIRCEAFDLTAGSAATHGQPVDYLWTIRPVCGR